MRLTIIGSGSGMPSRDRAHSCYAIAIGDRQYILDCGDGAVSAMLRCGVESYSIHNVFISHTHPDHVIGLPMFIQMEHLKKRREQLTIHIPSEFESAFHVMLNALYLFPSKLAFDLRVDVIEDGYRFDDGGLQIAAHANSHLQVNRQLIESGRMANLMQCFSFVITGDNRKMVYSSDIGALNDIRDVVPDTDLLLTEGMHIDIESLPAFLIENRVGRCVLTHLQDGFDRESARAQFAKAGYDDLDFADEGWTAQV